MVSAGVEQSVCVAGCGALIAANWVLNMRLCAHVARRRRHWPRTKSPLSLSRANFCARVNNWAAAVICICKCARERNRLIIQRTRNLRLHAEREREALSWIIACRRRSDFPGGRRPEAPARRPKNAKFVSVGDTNVRFLPICNKERAPVFFGSFQRTKNELKKYLTLCLHIQNSPEVFFSSVLGTKASNFQGAPILLNNILI